MEFRVQGLGFRVWREAGPEKIGCRVYPLRRGAVLAPDSGDRRVVREAEPRAEERHGPVACHDDVACPGPRFSKSRYVFVEPLSSHSVHILSQLSEHSSKRWQFFKSGSGRRGVVRRHDHHLPASSWDAQAHVRESRAQQAHCSGKLAPSPST